MTFVYPPMSTSELKRVFIWYVSARKIKYASTAHKRWGSPTNMSLVCVSASVTELPKRVMQRFTSPQVDGALCSAVGRREVE